MLQTRCLAAALVLLSIHATVMAQPIQSMEIIINRFELFSTGGGAGVITFSSLSSGSVNGQPWPHVPFGVQLAPLSIVGSAPVPSIPAFGPITSPYFMNTLPIPGGLQLTDSSGGVAAMTVNPNMGRTFPGVPTDPFSASADVSPGEPSPYGPNAFLIDGGLLLDSNGGPFDFSAFGWDVGGGLLSLMLYGAESGANWDQTLLEGGKMSGYGILTITGTNNGNGGANQVPEPAIWLLWSAASTVGLVWTRRRQTRLV